MAREPPQDVPPCTPRWSARSMRTARMASSGRTFPSPCTCSSGSIRCGSDALGPSVPLPPATNDPGRSRQVPPSAETESEELIPLCSGDMGWRRRVPLTVICSGRGRAAGGAWRARGLSFFRSTTSLRLASRVPVRWRLYAYTPGSSAPQVTNSGGPRSVNHGPADSVGRRWMAPSPPPSVARNHGVQTHGVFRAGATTR